MVDVAACPQFTLHAEFVRPQQTMQTYARSSKFPFAGAKLPHSKRTESPCPCRKSNPNILMV